MFAGNFAPTGWALCNGQLLLIGQNTALFSLLGTTYGGDGKSTFALPNLQGRYPMHWGQGPGLTDRAPGESGGEATVTLLESELPQHTHVPSGSLTPTLRCVTGSGNQATPVGNVPAGEAFGTTATYAPAADQSTMALPVATQPVGASQPHENMPPALAVTFIIALQGVFPPRS